MWEAMKSDAGLFVGACVVGLCWLAWLYLAAYRDRGPHD